MKIVLSYLRTVQNEEKNYFRQEEVEDGCLGLN